MSSNKKKIKEVTVFTNGDSSKINTWSNVPYFFTATLLAKGIVVNRVDLSPSDFIRITLKRTFYRFLKMINPRSSCIYYRSVAHFIDVRHRIKRAIKQYPNTDANIFLTFSFSSAGLTQKPTVQFGDWTYDHSFKHFKDKKPGFFDRQSIRREDSQIRGSDLVFPLFPSVAEYMQAKYKTQNIHYLGNVINSLYENSEDEVFRCNANSTKILFVGGKQYIEGAKSLIKAFEGLKQKIPLLSLHIIGMDADDFEYVPKDVFCYGYLDKGQDADRDLYYKLFKEAKVFVNTTPKWAAFSASIEAMYFYLPVVVTPCNEFVETFGKDIDFGCYCDKNTPACIEEKIINIFNDKSYNTLSVNAHNAVKEYTWDSYIDRVIGKIEEKINAK